MGFYLTIQGVSPQKGDLKQKLVFGDSLDRFKEVGVQTKFMFQFFLAFLKKEGTEIINISCCFLSCVKEIWNREVTWKKAQSEHCLHRLSERGLFWQ